MASWGALDEAIAGEVLLPGSPGFDEQPKGFNARFHDVSPEAIVRCATAADVAEAISFVTRHGSAGPVARSGGHCFAGRSSTRGVLVDVAPMDDVRVAPSGDAAGDQAIIGAGARLGSVYEALGRHGRTIPGGTCPSVGIAGLTLGGGLGILGRTYGVTSDRLTGAQIVLADGRIVDCDGDREADLFWALRGAGAGNFGVVTSLTFRTVPAPEATNLHLTWPHTAAGAVVDAWQRWAPQAPDRLAASLKITTTGDVDRPPAVDVYGGLLDGSEPEADDLIDRLVTLAGSAPTSVVRRRLPYRGTRRFWADLGAADATIDAHDAAAAPDPDPLELPLQHPYLFAKSEFFRQPLPREAITALVTTLERDRRPGEERELDFMPWGGAYNRVRADATAFVHRNELFQVKHSAVLDPEPAEAEEPAVSSPPSRGAQAAVQRWVAASWLTVHPWGSGRVFQNFADPDLPDWPEAYYGPNYQRLVDVKRRYDPQGAFRFHQSLPG